MGFGCLSSIASNPLMMALSGGSPNLIATQYSRGGLAATRSNAPHLVR